MEWIGCCEKSRCNVAQTFPLIAQVHPVLHRVSCSYETIPNAPKHYETHQNMSLGSNGVGQMHWLRKITTRLRGTNFCINWDSSVCFCNKFDAVTEWSQMHINTILHQNMSLGSNGADWVHSLWKIPTWLRGTNFYINCTSSPYFASSLMQLRNAAKHYATH